MNFEAWFAAPRQEPLGANERQIVTTICDALRDPFAPGPMEPDEVFEGLCKYCRAKYSYGAVVKGLTSALRERALNCAAASDLVVGIVLNLGGKDLDVSRFDGPFGGQRPVVTPRIFSPGVTIENNVTGGGGRMLFTGGHYVARVSDDQYDLISGLRSHRIPYIEARRIADVGGQPTYGCDVDGVPRSFVKVPGNTMEGLSRFTVAPVIG